MPALGWRKPENQLCDARKLSMEFDIPIHTVYRWVRDGDVEMRLNQYLLWKELHIDTPHPKSRPSRNKACSIKSKNI